MLPWQRHTRYLNYQNMTVYPFNCCLAKFGDRGISSFEKWQMWCRYQKLCSATLIKKPRGFIEGPWLGGGGGGPGGTCSIHDGGGWSDGASYCEPNEIHEPEILHPKNTWRQNFLPKKMQY